MSRLIAGVSFVDRRGALLYFRAFPLSAHVTAPTLELPASSTDHDPAALELAMFASQDYINEKLAGSLMGGGTPGRPVAMVRQGGPAPAAPGDLYLGLLVRGAARWRACSGRAVRAGAARRAPAR